MWWKLITKEDPITAVAALYFWASFRAINKNVGCPPSEGMSPTNPIHVVGPTPHKVQFLVQCKLGVIKQSKLIVRSCVKAQRSPPHQSSAVAASSELSGRRPITAQRSPPHHSSAVAALSQLSGRRPITQPDGAPHPSGGQTFPRGLQVVCLELLHNRRLSRSLIRNWNFRWIINIKIWQEI